MMSLNYQMVLTLCQIIKIISNISLNHEVLTATPHIHVYINKINNSSVFKIKIGYRLEL